MLAAIVVAAACGQESVCSDAASYDFTALAIAGCIREVTEAHQLASESKDAADEMAKLEIVKGVRYASWGWCLC